MTPRQIDNLIVLLSDRDRRVLIEAVPRMLAHDVVEETESFVMQAQLEAARLSDTLRLELLRFRRYGSLAGAILVRGAPLGEIPRTPEQADAAVGATLAAAAVMSILIAPLGDQCGFAPELGGSIVQDILPVRGFEDTQQSIGATVDLLRHVEMAFLEQRADYIALLCVRADHDGKARTTLSSIDDILGLLSPADIGVLRGKRFRTTVDGSFLRGAGISGPIWVDPICALSGPEDRPWLRVDFAETEGTDPVAQSALDRLAAAAADVEYGVSLRPGDLMCIDNRRAFHGRSLFQPRYDGSDRWLLRSFVMKNLALSEDVRPHDGRVIDPGYGAVRGLRARGE